MTKMKTITLKLPTLEKLSSVFYNMSVINNGGTYVRFGNDSEIDLKDFGKSVTLKFSPADNWTWCIGKTSFTGIDTDDLRTLFPKRKFKAPRRHTRVGCNSVSLDDDLDIIVGSHTMTEKEIQEVEELLASRRELKEENE